MNKSRGIHIAALSAAMIGSLVAVENPGEPPWMKMTTDIFELIIMFDKIQTRIGTLELLDGFPTEETARRDRTLRKHGFLVTLKR
jgi:hypothetical protein